ncbi:GNAT family N-acetyltransferase [Roseomonas terrae]|jgi:GNAT superfamily N-acetyltransferase|uniref:GNAT family N-acetyltransferase n=1 Tax=Neoroseomonas terrae TaxID=424799 RepID=A0ABS5ED36_9PROT|nr:GNAT family N-acetyltransferase [Neoroseomonas terrae]MBR0648926.1 GNAT family N-acetyltransferase [Neoroseomonas terrae]
MAIAIRPATSEDLDPAQRLVERGILDLRARHGVGLPLALGPPDFQRPCLEEDPSGLWVGEAEGTVRGFGFSWMCERFWFLAQLFVEPGEQGSGLGRTLLSRTMEQARRRGAENLALITFAYNRVSTGLYIRHGMFPREPIYLMAAPAGAVGLPEPAPDLDAVPAESSWMRQIDEAVLGFGRDRHHAMLLAGGETALGFARGGRIVGYAYVSTITGHVGPAAILPGEDVAGVLRRALRVALSGGAKSASIFVPGRCGPGLSAMTEAGLRIEEPFVLLAARPFGIWDNYVPADPGYM